jgi:hypothetical protein
MGIRTLCAGVLSLALTTGAVLTANAAFARPSDLPAPYLTETVTGTGTGYGQLVNVRTGRHDAYDRVVFDFTGGTPGYRVAYEPLVGQGTGNPVPLAGNASLVVVFNPTNAHGYDITRTLNPNLPTLKQIRFGGDFEGYVSAGVGLSGTVGFRVFQLHNPDRVVIDVAHSTPFGCGGA